MGGFFGGGSSAPTYVAPVPAPAPAPAPVAVENGDPDAEARKQREDAMARNRRGRAGMVATSERGVLAQAPVGGKSLLGE